MSCGISIVTMYCALEVCLKMISAIFLFTFQSKSNRVNTSYLQCRENKPVNPEALSLSSSHFNINFMLFSYIQAQYKQNTVSTKYSGFSIASLQSIIRKYVPIFPINISLLYFYCAVFSCVCIGLLLQLHMYMLSIMMLKNCEIKYILNKIKSLFHLIPFLMIDDKKCDRKHTMLPPLSKLFYRTLIIKLFHY